MREILFRGKHMGVWFSGNLICIEKLGYMVDISIQESGISYQVNEETVGQYTGLKDKNGKMIFEGDIVRDKFKRIYKVFFSQYSMDWRLKHKDQDDDRYFEWLYPKIQLEVIGNIHDNPELLEEEEAKIK